MAEHEPTTVDAISGDSTERGEPMPWEEVREVLANSQFYWFATVGPAGAPHVRPVLAVWADGALYTTTSPRARKARNLELDGRCAVTVREEGYDLVLEGTATRVCDEPTLEAVRPRTTTSTAGRSRSGATRTTRPTAPRRPGRRRTRPTRSCPRPCSRSAPTTTAPRAAPASASDLSGGARGGGPPGRGACRPGRAPGGSGGGP